MAKNKNKKKRKEEEKKQKEGQEEVSDAQRNSFFLTGFPG